MVAADYLSKKSRMPAYPSCLGHCIPCSFFSAVSALAVITAGDYTNTDAGEDSAGGGISSGGSGGGDRGGIGGHAAFVRGDSGGSGTVAWPWQLGLVGMVVGPALVVIVGLAACSFVAADARLAPPPAHSHPHPHPNQHSHDPTAAVVAVSGGRSGVQHQYHERAVVGALVTEIVMVRLPQYGHGYAVVSCENTMMHPAYNAFV